MINTRFTLALAVAGITVVALPVLAETTTTTTTTTTSTTRTTRVGSQPIVVQFDKAGNATILKTTVAVVPGTGITTEVTTVSRLVPEPDDLLNRRNDLVARVMVEQNRGQLSASEANNFLSRIQALEDSRVQLRRNEVAGMYFDGERACDTLSYHKEVRRIYNGYDSIANDMRDVSGQDDRQLAATYTYFAL